MSQIRQTIDTVWEIMDKHQLHRFADVAAPDMLMEAGGQVARGPKEIGEYLAAYIEAFPDLRHEVLGYLETGDTAAVRLRVTGTHRGPMRTPQGTVPPTGGKLVLESVDWITVQGGKIASWRGYFDTMRIMAAIGLAPGP